jgi:hypothetical protein
MAKLRELDMKNIASCPAKIHLELSRKSQRNIQAVLCAAPLAGQLTYNPRRIYQCDKEA